MLETLKLDVHNRHFYQLHKSAQHQLIKLKSTAMHNATMKFTHKSCNKKTKKTKKFHVVLGRDD